MIPNSNTSLTDGPLQPIQPVLPGLPPLEGQALNDFIINWMLGITGMDPGNIRPRWQPEPPNLPQAGNCWCAIGITGRPSDTYPYIGQEGDVAVMQRHEDLILLASFYDLGVDGYADFYCALLRDGMQIDQNLELLYNNGFAFIESGEPVAVPVIIKERWAYRVDLPITLRRNVTRTYPVKSLQTARVTLIADPQNTNPKSGITIPIVATGTGQGSGSVRDIETVNTKIVASS